MKKLSVLTTVLGRSGRSTIRVPLSVESNSATATLVESSGGADLLGGETDDHFEHICNDDKEDSSHARRSINSFANWERLRPHLLRATVEELCIPEGTNCCVCLVKMATIRCTYCGPRQFFCQSCAYTLHETRNQLHVMEQWTEDKFLPLFPNHGVIDLGHQCDSKFSKLFKLVDSFGNQHLKQVAVCNCESHAVTLARANFWPGSPDKPSIGFHFKLMDLAETLFLHNQVPLKDFAEMLIELVPALHPILITTMYRTLNSGCFEEYRNYKYKMRYLNSFVPNLYNGAECPLCPKENGTLIECVDACFGLARKKTKNETSISSRHGLLLFSDQDDVDNFVNNYQLKADNAAIQDCNRFHAGEVIPALRSKGKNQLFDEKGVFGRVCRHDFPKSFMNIKHGERISYSVYELEKLKRYAAPNNLKVILMYDIACILSNHLKGSEQENLLDDVGLCIPIFHCYGHKALCQVKYSPRKTPNVGLTDGEGVERLWSFMRQFAKITKEMSVDKRHDVLTDAALHYNEHVLSHLGSTLKNKYARATTLQITVDEEITNLMLKLPNNVNETTVQGWIENEMSEMTPSQEVLEYQWDETYLELLVERKKLRNELLYAQEEELERVAGIENKLTRNRKAITALERKHGIKATWKKGEQLFENAKKRLFTKKRQILLLAIQRLSSERMFLLELKAKYADGQALAIKLAKQITRVVAEMNKRLMTLNGMSDEPLEFDDIKDPQSEIFEHLMISQAGSRSTDIPYQLKKRIIRLVCIQNRCKEELVMVKEEMLKFVQFLNEQTRNILGFVAVNQPNNRYEHGLHSCLLKRVLVAEKQLQSLQVMWKDIIDFPHMSTATYYMYTKPEEIVAYSLHECDFYDVE